MAITNFCRELYDKAVEARSQSNERFTSMSYMYDEGVVVKNGKDWKYVVAYKDNSVANIRVTPFVKKKAAVQFALKVEGIYAKIGKWKAVLPLFTEEEV